MGIRRLLLAIGVGTTLSMTGIAASAGDAKPELRLSAGQRDYLWQEPILVRVETASAQGLPAEPGKGGASTTLRFEIEPAVKARPNGKPLPAEASHESARARDFDLVEWFQFPDGGGTWTVRAILEQGGDRLLSDPITISMHKPLKDDPEFVAMARLHHLPWSNYDTNAFCGDTFDVVKRWPESRFAKYCHYRNGRYLQGQKDYEKAIASYRTVIDKYPGFAMADDAERGIAECEQALKEAPKDKGKDKDKK